MSGSGLRSLELQTLWSEMSNTKKKVCMLGAFSVGKTSLVSRYVHSMFSERYQTTVGVRIEKKHMALNGSDLDLLIWDLHGEDDVHTVRDSYLRGASGYLLVLDGTRRETLAVARALKQRVDSVLGEKPFVALLNKADVRADWTVSEEDIESLRTDGWHVFETSAKSGDGVEKGFEILAAQLLD